MNAYFAAGELRDSLAEIRTSHSQFDIFRFLKRTVKLFELRSFLVVQLPAPTSLDLGENSIITNLPAEFLGAYDRNSLLTTSPLIARLRKSAVPFSFDFRCLAGERSGADAVSARSLYDEFGFVSGACVPVHDVDGGRSAIIFAGDRCALSERELAELTVISIHAFQRLMDVTLIDKKRDQPLTERELDCLTWTAAGKTSADIAGILSLSEHTVNHYLNRAAKKLDTVNRTQAVAKALRRGLIS